MRIIGGSLRGRHFGAPDGLGTRPMLDRVREALFSTLLPWLEGARVLDLFAGTGSLGLEALSRGAASARLVERDPSVVALLRRNVEALGLRGRAEVRRGDALARASWSPSTGLLETEPLSTPGFDVVFLDPPYALLEERASRERVLAAVAELVGTRLEAEGVLVLHAPRRVLARDALPLGMQAAEREYGTNALWYLQAQTPEAGP